MNDEEFLNINELKIRYPDIAEQFDILMMEHYQKEMERMWYEYENFEEKNIENQSNNFELPF